MDLLKDANDRASACCSAGVLSFFDARRRGEIDPISTHAFKRTDYSKLISSTLRQRQEPRASPFLGHIFGARRRGIDLDSTLERHKDHLRPVQSPFSSLVAVLGHAVPFTERQGRPVTAMSSNPSIQTNSPAAWRERRIIRLLRRACAASARPRKQPCRRLKT